MVQRKLIRLFQTLPSNEFNEFGRMVNSDFFNRKESLRNLFIYIKKELKKREPAFDTVDIFEYVFPKEKLSAGKEKSKLAQKKIDGLLYEMKVLLEDFLAWKQMKDEPHQKGILLLKKLENLGADEYFFDKAKKVEKIIDAHKGTLTFHLQQYQLTLMLYEHPRTNKLSSKIDFIDKTHYHLDAFFGMSKMIHTWIYYGRKKLFNTGNPPQFENEVISLVDSGHFEDNNVIKAFALAIKSNRTGNFNLSDYLKIKKWILKDINSYDLKGQIGLHNFLVDYCLFLKWFSKLEFNQREMFFLYNLGLEKGYIYRNGFITFADFTNMCYTACILDEFEWAEHFIENYQHQLKDDIRSSAILIGKANLAYYKDKPEDALDYLKEKGSATSVPDNLIERSLRLKCYYDLDWTDLFESTIESFRKFLLRTFEEKEGIYHYFNNFNKTARKIYHNKRDKSALESIKQDILKSEQIANFEWLLEKTGMKLHWPVTHNTGE